MSKPDFWEIDFGDYENPITFTATSSSREIFYEVSLVHQTEGLPGFGRSKIHAGTLTELRLRLEYNLNPGRIPRLFNDLLRKDIF